MDCIQRTFLGHSYHPSDLRRIALSLLWIAALLPTDTVRAQTPETRIEFLKYGAMAENVAVSRDGNHIAIGVREASGRGSQVVLWSRSLQGRVWRRSFATQQAPDVAFDSTGTRLAIARGHGEIVIVDPDDGHTVESGDTNVSTALRSALETDASPRRLAFGPSSSQAVFTSGDTQITLLNYKLNPTKKINASNFCKGKIIEIKLPPNSQNIYFTTRAYAECDPDYFCVVNSASQSLVEKYSRKNISQIEVIENGEVAYSRGKYVYRFNLQSGVEEVVFHSENTVNDLSFAQGRLVIANSDVVILKI